MNKQEIIDRFADIDALEAGPELDAMIAEEVMGINLKPSLDRAKMKVGYHRIGATGPEGFSVKGVDRLVQVPAGATLPEPADDVNDWNARYPIWIVDNVLNLNGELDDEIDAVRNDPMPYSDLISFAWEVVEKLTGNEDRKHPVFFKCNYRWFYRAEQDYVAYAAFDWKLTGDSHPLYPANADTMPHAICLAALKVITNA